MGGGLALAGLGLTAARDRRLPWQPPPARLSRLAYLGPGASEPNRVLLAAWALDRASRPLSA
jgi:hypothetical protein